jgi:hypothetical protein
LCAKLPLIALVFVLRYYSLLIAGYAPTKAESGVAASLHLHMLETPVCMFLAS